MGTVTSPIHREPELLGQTVVVIGGSAGIGFETARRARAEGAKVILTGRNAERLQHAASSLKATLALINQLQISVTFKSSRFHCPNRLFSCSTDIP